MSQLGLRGTIAPGSLSLLPLVQSIDLSENQLSGAVPADFNQGEALPELASLLLSSNLLTGVPAGWGQGGCSRLQLLRLDGNNLTALPEGLSLPGLETLTVGSNQIGGKSSYSIQRCGCVGGRRGRGAPVHQSFCNARSSVRATCCARCRAGSIPRSWNISASARVWLLPQDGEGPCGEVCAGRARPSRPSARRPAQVPHSPAQHLHTPG